MTNKEKYQQAFHALHASENISLEKNMDREKHFHPGKKLVGVCLCAALVLALGATAFAYRDVISNRIFGWGNNLEITQGVDENGEDISVSILCTENMTEPVILSEGRMIFIVNGENIDITDQLSQTKAFQYEYTDGEGNTHFWLVGLNSDELENYGYAEYIKDSTGLWAGGYSARVNIEPDGSTNAQWLEAGKAELQIPWGKTDLDITYSR